MTGRVVARLSELVDNFDLRRRPVKSSDRGHGRYPYYGASGVVDFIDKHIYDGEYLLISEDGENLRTRATPIAFLARGQFWVNNHAHVVRANRRSDTRYLMYHLAYLDISGYLTGSTLPKLTRSAMDSIILNIPSLADQVAIGRVLGALDDKIAANAELARTAEELAVALCGGSSDAVALAEVCEPVRQTVDPSVLGVPLVEHFSLPAFDATHRPDLVEPSVIKSAKSLISEPSVLISKLNPRFPRVWDVAQLPEVPAVASTEFVVLRPRFCSTTVLSAVLLQHRFKAEVEGKVSGTSGSHQRVRPVDILATPVVDPRQLPEAVKSAVTACGLRAAQAREESAVLVAMRDTLLPHLMSGRLRVRDAEKTVSDAV